MPYDHFSVPNSVHKLPHTESCVNTECSTTHFSKSCTFLHCTILEYDN